jgi:peptide/nickel transport system ATP-binding protein
MTDKHGSTEALVSVRNLTRTFDVRGGQFGQSRSQVRALQDVSFDVFRGETLSIVGESGSGKSTLGMSVLQLTRPTSGSVWYRGKDIVKNTAAQNRAMRRHLQIVFQDPFSTLNPRATVGSAISLPLLHHGLVTRATVRDRVHAILSDVGLGPLFENRYPHELSGGQAQRVAIGRAIACEPEFIVCDEAISALDVSVQAQIINLLVDLQEKHGLTYLFIAHDLSVVRHISDRVAVMQGGRILEIDLPQKLFNDPQHAYTQALISATPVFEKRLGN